MLVKFLKVFIISAVAFVSVNTQAVLIHQDVSLSVSSADDGNGFDLLSGFEGVIGFIQYESDETDFGFVDGTNSAFDFELNLGDFLFTPDFDISFPDFPLATLFDLDDGLSGIGYLDSEMEDNFANVVLIFENSIAAIDSFGLGFEGMLSFSDAKVVPEPQVLFLMLAGLMGLVVVRKRSQQS